jgi:hypothetical protein
MALTPKRFLREKDIQQLEMEIHNGKILVKHLLKMFKKKFKNEDIVQETEILRLLRDQQNKSEISVAQYTDILFNMIIRQIEFRAVDNMSDFEDLVDHVLMKIMDIDKTGMVEFLFIEKIDNEWSFIICSKNKVSLDLYGKEFLIFMIEWQEP